MTPSKKNIEVAAGVVVRDGRYLITQRLSTAPHGGLWEFPGGKRHPEESLKNCLRREFKEELDVAVEVGEELKVVRHAYPEFTVTLHFYRCTILNGTPQTLGNQAYRWVHPDELSGYSFPEANQGLIRELQNHP